MMHPATCGAEFCRLMQAYVIRRPGSAAAAYARLSPRRQLIHSVSPLSLSLWDSGGGGGSGSIRIAGHDRSEGTGWVVGDHDIQVARIRHVIMGNTAGFEDRRSQCATYKRRSSDDASSYQPNSMRLGGPDVRFKNEKLLECICLDSEDCPVSHGFKTVRRTATDISLLNISIRRRYLIIYV